MSRLRPTFHFAVSIQMLGILSGCSTSASDATSLIEDGDERACAAPEVKERLQERLTPFLQYRNLKTEWDGRSLAQFGFVFDPIIATSAESGHISCATAGYLSLDGRQPIASNQVQVEYNLSTNLNDAEDFVLSGNFTSAQEITSILYQNLGVLE